MRNIEDKGVPSVFLLRSLRSLRKTDGTPGRYPLSVKGIALGDLAATTHQDATYVYVCASIDYTFTDCVTCDIISAHALNNSCHDFSSLVFARGGLRTRPRQGRGDRAHAGPWRD